MSIFESIKNAIFGHKAAAATPAPAAAPKPQVTAGSVSAAPSTAVAASPPQVNIEEALADMAKKNGQKLNWQTSIVDLMKLVGLDSSLQNRQHLAVELGYSGNPSDSASMNVWLHKQVMQKLAQSGGSVPDSLKH